MFSRPKSLFVHRPHQIRHHGEMATPTSDLVLPSPLPVEVRGDHHSAAEAEQREAEVYMHLLRGAIGNSRIHAAASLQCSNVLMTPALKTLGVEQALRDVLRQNAKSLQSIDLSGSTLPFQAYVCFISCRLLFDLRVRSSHSSARVSLLVSDLCWSTWKSKSNPMARACTSRHTLLTAAP